MALAAETFEHHLFTGHLKPFVDFRGDGDVVVILVVKIYDAAAPNAPEVMMNAQIRVVSLRLPVPLDDFNQADFRECQQGPVDRIERDIRYLLDDSLIDVISGGVVLGLQEFLENRRSLGSDFQPVFPGFPAK